MNEFIVPWHCVYPLEYLVGLESETGDKYGYFIPKIYDVVTVTLLLKPGEGTGEFPVAMMLYKDNTYDEVYNEAPQLNVTDRLELVVLIISESNFFEHKYSEISVIHLIELRTKNPSHRIEIIFLLGKIVFISDFLLKFSTSTKLFLIVA